MWKKQERKAVNAEFLNLLGQIDSEIHLPIILQEVRKELRNGLLLIIQSRNKMQSQPLHMKQQYFVQIKLSQFYIEQLWILESIIFKY